MTPPAKGKFRINFNRTKKPGDTQPALERGIISTPDAPDETFDVKLWARRDKAGRVFYSGPSSLVTTQASGLERTEALLDAEEQSVDAAAHERDAGGPLVLAANRVMLFRNGFKIGESDPRYASLSEAEQKLNQSRPDLYGYWQPGTDKDGVVPPQLKVAVWEQDGRYGPFLGGNTQVPQPGKGIAHEVAAPEVAVAVAEPKAKRRKGERDGR